MYDLSHIILHECEVAQYTFHAKLINILPVENLNLTTW
jgi:hypothetical protein